MTFDHIRGVTLMFGGYDGALLDETWAWDGLHWDRLLPATKPPARQEMGIGFDHSNGRVVIFGGRANGANRNDTWGWDGQTWANLQPATTPAARQNGAMAGDPDRGVIVMFGGQGGALLGDTWEFDGTDWSQIVPADPEGDGNPSARQHHRLAFDPTDRTVILCGGDPGGAECWSWNGSSWAQRPGLAQARFGAGLASHHFGGVGGLVQFGGRNWSAGVLQDTLHIEATGVTSQAPTATPGGRFYHGLAYDASRGVAVLFGGLDATFVMSDETWEY